MGIGTYDKQEEDLLEIAERGDLPELLRQLSAVVSRFGCHRGPMTEAEKLLNEALDYCRLGDLNEATHRLRLAVRPKWPSQDVCMDAYNRAMEGDS